MSWQIVGDTFTLFGTGPVPRIVGGTPDPAPPSPSPPPPPSPPPAEDSSPFAWPAPPTGLRYDPAERNVGLGQGFYATPQEFQNPLPGSNLYAGLLPEGMTVFGGRVFVGSYRLWAPHDAAPATIRRVLATGRV